MTLGLLDPPPAPTPAPTPAPGDVLEHLAAAAESIRCAQAWPAEVLGDQALAEAVAGLARIESQAAALRGTLTVEADRRQVAEQTAETGTDAWVARLTGTTRAQAAGGIRLARLLHDTYAATREAYAAGRLRTDQVRVIVHAAEQAPPEATPAQVAAAERWLVDRATGDARTGAAAGRPMDAKQLRQTARRMFATVDADLAARHEAILLGREARTADNETYLALYDNGNGTFSGRFTIPELHGHLLTQVLDRLTAPRRLTRDRAGTPIIDQAATGHGSGANIYETRGAALCELIEHLPTTGWPGHAGNGCEVLVTIDLESLLTGLGTARLDTGTTITAAEARRLACNAGLVPAVLDGHSMPLDLGRKQRLHTRTQRRALSLTHHTCAIAGCDRPFAWCEIHHPTPWGHHGPTNLNNGLPLCGHHHRRAHHPHWNLTPQPDGDWTFHRRT